MFRLKQWTARNLGDQRGYIYFADFEGKSLKDFKDAVEYHSKTGHDVLVWWEALVPKPPEKGWEAEKYRIYSVIL